MILQNTVEDGTKYWEKLSFPFLAMCTTSSSQDPQPHPNSHTTMLVWKIYGKRIIQFEIRWSSKEEGKPH